MDEERATEAPESGSTESESEPRPSAPATSAAFANAVALGVTLTSAGVIAYAFAPERAGEPSMLAALGALYAALGAFTIYRMHQRGELRRRFLPARGDITFAAVTAGGLYGAVRIGGSLLAPIGSPRELWIMRVYLQMGGMPERRLLGATVFAIAALEELVWRGLVMRSQQDVSSNTRAALLSTLLYAAAHLPTLSLLRMPGAGPNPLLVVASLACGLVFALLVLRTGRLTPALLAHALFSWSLIEFPLWQPSGP
jgi:membrane protease YdiL (CAAX protease family)